MVKPQQNLTKCDHLQVAIRGNYETGYAGATCEQCGAKLERRVVGHEYDYRTAQEWAQYEARGLDPQTAREDEARGAKS